MRDLENEIHRSIERYALLTPGRPVGVALSGGADSVALLAALTALGYDCVALHCNFHLRGAESDRDALAARRLADALGARWQTVDFDVARRRAATGESVEMACRELRYAWFGEMVASLGLQAVAVGHHRDDRIETFMLNAVRGTGLRGLASMGPRRSHYVRPMLGCTRSDIESYLTERQLAYVTDSSNLSDDYQRNRVRHHVVPALEAVRPDAGARFADTLDRLADARSLYEWMLSGYRQRYVDGADGSINLRQLMSESGDMARLLLYELISPHGLNMAQAGQIIASAAESGRRFGSLLLDRGRLIPVAAPSSGSECVEIDPWCPGDGGLRVREVPREEFSPKRDPNIIYLDGVVFEEPRHWTLRRWRHADRFRPFGMRGTRLVSDLLSDAGLSVEEKRRVRILTCDGQIVWVVGMRASALWPVTPATRRIYEISIE